MEMNNNANSGYNKYDTDRLEDLTILWGTQKKITSNNFKGGNVTSILGYSEIDLTNSKLDNKSVVIDVLGIFGGSTLIVSKDWNVVVDVFSLFGGFSTKIIRTPETKVDIEKTLTIKGLILFGYGEVKSLI